MHQPPKKMSTIVDMEFNFVEDASKPVLPDQFSGMRVKAGDDSLVVHKVVLVAKQHG